MSDIQRYEPWPQEWPMEDANGDLVTYEDHRKAVEAVEAKLAECLERNALLEARLGKAVEALEEISEHDTGATAGLAYTAKHHLAEIKSGIATTPYGLEGESHE